MVMCFVPDCKHYSERDGCRFFVFPKDPKEKFRWIKLIRREDKEPSKYSLVCSCHFKDKDRENGPTIFERNIKKLIDFQSPPKKKKKVIKQRLPSPVPGLSTRSDSPISVAPSSSDSQIPGPSWRVDSPLLDVVNQMDESEGEIVAPSDMTTTINLPAMEEARVYFLEKELKETKKALEKGQNTMTFKSIEDNDKLINIYTGIPTKHIFMALFNLLDKCTVEYFYKFKVEKIEKIDQLLLTLMKLRLNLLLEDLAFRFKVSKKTVSNVFKTWLFAIHEILFKKYMSKVPTREKNKLCMPSCFSQFTNCRIILDCTEVFTAHPKSMDKQRATYSSYKHRNTLKGLVGVAPNGVIVFVSSLYPGSTSDKEIVGHCNIIPIFKPGDLVIADKGFLISDLLPPGVSLNIPPFLSTTQFTPEQAIMTRTIAQARIHVERAIRRIKCYSILSTVPQNLVTHSSIIFQVCAALTNLQFPLIKEVEDLYMS